MGLAALIVFLSSLLVGLLSLAVLGWSALQIYRTFRYAQKDAAAWSDKLGERVEGMRVTLEGMEARASDLSEKAQEIHAGLEDIADTWEELRSHPAIGAARFVGRLRRRGE